MAARKPRVVVDARAAGGSGIGRYLDAVLSVLVRDERFAAVDLLGDVSRLERYRDGGRHPAVSVASVPTRLYSPRFQLEWWLRRGHVRSADAFFFPHFDAPVFLPARSVVVVHDLIHFKVPAAFPAWQRRAAALLLSAVTRRAAGILVPSPCTLRDLDARFPGVGRKTSIAPLGLADRFVTRHEPTASARKKARDMGRFLLCVGNRKPHKNLATVVRAMPRLLERWPDLKLVVVGREFGGDDTFAAAGELSILDRVVGLGEVDDDELSALYEACAAFVFPSLYEGFGIPLLEAMAYDAPIAASSAASIPEVVGDAAILFDPRSPQSLAEGVGAVLGDETLRDRLVAAGQRRFEAFDWERTAGGVVNLLYGVATSDRVVAGGRPADRFSSFPQLDSRPDGDGGRDRGAPVLSESRVQPLREVR